MEIEKVYRVTNYALSGDHPDNDINTVVVRNHGYLWKCLGRKHPGDDWFYFTSIATGKTEPWYPDEMEKVT